MYLPGKERLRLGWQAIAADTETATLHEGFHFAGNGSKVDRRAQNKGIRLSDLFQNWRQIILRRASPIAWAVLRFAGEAALAARIFQIVKMYEPRFRSLGRGSFQGFLQQGCRVPGLSRTSVECHHLHMPPPRKWHALSSDWFPNQCTPELPPSVMTVVTTVMCRPRLPLI